MDYITTSQASKEWNITANRITIMAKKGQIKGAIKIGTNWMIPKGTIKPIDGRTKIARETLDDIFFRFPLFIGKNINSFNPKLTCEELQLKEIEEAFFACQFDNAKNLLSNLSKTTKNIYILIFSLYFECLLSILYNEPSNFFDAYGRFEDILEKDFPYKKEMKLIFEELNATISTGEYFSNKFIVDPEYNYHPSFASHLSAITVLSLFFQKSANLTIIDINSYEQICKLVNENDYPVDSQTMHLYLGFINHSLGLFKRSTYHYHKVFEIAQKYNLYYIPAEGYCFLRETLESTLLEYPADFVSLIIKCSKDISNRYSVFTKNTSSNSIFKFISQDKYLYIYYAICGYRNKEVARHLNISEKTVSKNYGKIYTQLGFDNKKELIDYCLKQKIK